MTKKKKGHRRLPLTGSPGGRKSGVQNLIVPVCIATSHLAYGAYRLESPYMVEGHSAGVAAAMAVASNAAVQDVSVPALQKVLRAQGQILTLAERKPFPAPPGPAPPPEPVPLAVGPCADAAASTMTVKAATVKSSIVKLLLNARSECASAYGTARLMAHESFPPHATRPTRPQAKKIKSGLLCRPMEASSKPKFALRKTMF